MTEEITITLTRQEYYALLSILVDHRLKRDSTIEWINVADDHTVTIDDLLGKLMQAYNRIGNDTPAAPEEKR